MLQQKNLLAIVIWTHQEWLNTRKKPQQRLQSKLAITHILYEYGFSKDAFVDLLCFIDWTLALPAPFEIQYTQYIKELEEKKSMSYVTSFERIGIDIGMSRGRAQGKKEGELLIVSNLFQRRFGKIPHHLQEKLNSATQQQLLYWSEALLDAKTIEDIFL